MSSVRANPRGGDASAVRAVKGELFSRLNDPRHSIFRDKEEERLKAVLSSAFDSRSSSATLVTGTSNERNRNFVHKVLDDFQSVREKEHRQPCSVATITGATAGDDRQAMMQLAKALGFVTNGQNFGVNMDAIQDFLKLGQLQKVPTVLILESFDEFAKTNRQTLLYTLLDLMHRKDLLFVLIGTTCSADISFQLEKRVMSRLNAQFVELAPPSPFDICKELAARLQCGRIGESEAGLGYCEEFNRRITTLFGSMKAQPIGLTSPTTRSLKRRRDDEVEEPPHPSILRQIELFSQWGIPFSAFLMAARKCALQLSVTMPFITQTAFLDGLAETCPNVANSMIIELPTRKMWMFAACVRLHYRSKKSNSSSGISLLGDASRRRQASRGFDPATDLNLVSFSASSVIGEFDKLIKLTTNEAVLKRDMFSALAELEDLRLIRVYNGSQGVSRVSPSCTITDETAVLLGISPVEAKLIFQDRNLKIPDRIRRAVLEPLDPLHGDSFHTEQSLDMLT